MSRTKQELTEEREKILLDTAQDARSIRSTCTLLGVSKGVFYRWKEENPDLFDRYGKIRAQALQATKAEAEECVIDAIRKGEVRAAQWWLSHRHPSEYAEGRIISTNENRPSPHELILAALAEAGECKGQDNSEEPK